MTVPVTAVYKAQNRKLGKGDCNATYVSQRSCDPSCPFLGEGCYANYGLAAVTTNRLNNATDAETPAQLARLEASAIDLLRADRPLRLHVVGDCRTSQAARTVARAAERYMERGGEDAPVWTYTHAWRKVKRSAWGSVAVLASCETPEDVELAHSLGYATAIVAPSFPTHKAHNMTPDVRVIPCPYEEGGDVTCESCRLCFDDARLHASGLTIGFPTHSQGKNLAADAVNKRIALQLAR